MTDNLLTRIDELERLRCAATPAPWFEASGRNEFAIATEAVPFPSEDLVRYGGHPVADCDFGAWSGENVQYIIAARNTTLLAEARDEIVRLRAEVEALKSEVGALADHLHDASPAIPITRNDIDRLVKMATRQPRQPQPCPHGCWPVNGTLYCEPCATGMEE